MSRWRARGQRAGKPVETSKSRRRRKEKRREERYEAVQCSEFIQPKVTVKTHCPGSKWNTKKKRISPTEVEQIC